MKRVLIPLLIIASLVFVVCGGKVEETTMVVTESGEMIEVLTPAPNDTFSWALVSGNASITQGLFYAELIGEDGESVKLINIELDSKAPDTVAFGAGISVTEEAPLEKGYLKAYSHLSPDEVAIFSVYLLPSPVAANGAIQRFYMALDDTSKLEQAWEFLVKEGATYPDFYEGEISFGAAPEKPEDLKTWKKEDEMLRLLAIRRLPVYELPESNLFVCKVWVEHISGDAKSVEETYVFLVKQPDGLFLLYRPRKDLYKPDEEL